jgi:TetR/AcrR family transcriptional regulator, cholesterol catabolism regulator
MPRTRRELEREEKVAEIVAAATRQALAGGFGALSIAAIARELGVAQNAIYWYFPSRDHLFVAVLRQLMADVIARKPPTGDVPARAVWLVDRVAEVHPLLIAMRERAKVADVVADFERELDALVRAMIGHALDGAVPAAELRVATESFLSTIEGALLRGLSRKERAQVVTYTLARLGGRDSVRRGG